MKIKQTLAMLRDNYVVNFVLIITEKKEWLNCILNLGMLIGCMKKS